MATAPSSEAGAAPRGAPPVIELRNVSKSFGHQRVLDGISLAVEPRRNTVIIGRSGTGKSVLLKHIVGLLRPDAGEVYFDGRRIDRLSERALVPVRQQIAFVFQLNALFDSLRVIDNVAFPMWENGRIRASRKAVRDLAARCLAQVGLAGFEHKWPAELSGGEKKRVAIARAIAMDPPPKVILYDEPTAGLDPQRCDVVHRLIRQLQREFHVTGLVVTHDMNSAQAVGDRVLMLWNGRFVADGTPEQVLRSDDPHVYRFTHGIAEPHDLSSLSPPER